ncbi:MAG TPA: CoA-binding protein [Gemmatirosa sp.]|jgi:predicted CoA-binding protein|nr:CoA-binding protein [Gemmatirosa sp.]
MPHSTPGSAAGGADDWRRHLLDDGAAIRALLQRVRRIAVLGIKTPDGFPPAHYVPEAAQRAGYEVIPVPVYYPEVTELLGQPVYRRVADIPGPPVDLVDVFRRPQDLPAHLDDLLAARPGAVWLQSGIRHAEVAETLARAGIDVVQDRCLMVEIQRAGR